MNFLIQSGLTVLENTWLIAALSVKYVIASHLGYYYSKYSKMEGFQDEVVEYAPAFVTSLFAAGILFSAVKYTPSPAFSALGEITALAYFGYLFWIY